MISLYESILKSTGSGKNFLKTYLIKEGWVYNPEGISPCLGVGHHSGVEPKIIEYDT